MTWVTGREIQAYRTTLVWVFGLMSGHKQISWIDLVGAWQVFDNVEQALHKE